MNEYLNPYPGGRVARLAAGLLRSLRGRVARAEMQPVVTLQRTATEVLTTVRGAQSARLAQIFDGCEEFPGLRVFVHGSWADDTKTGFSDLDDFIILDPQQFDRQSTRRLVRWLNRVDMRMCRIDPLQHHGHWIVCAEDLVDYDAANMPPAALQGAICLQGDPLIRFLVSQEKSRAGYRRVLSGLLQNIELFSTKYFSRSINAYEMKGFVSSILLVPALIMQLGGEQTDKRSAILSADRVLPPEACKVVAVCSAIRTGWAVQLNAPKFVLFRALAGLFFNPHFFRRFAAHFSPRYARTDVEIEPEDLNVLKKYIRSVLAGTSC